MRNGRLNRGWRLFRTSLRVIAANRKLLLFPVVIVFSMMAIAVFFIAPVVSQPTGHSWSQIAHWKTVVKSVVVVDPQLQPTQQEGPQTSPLARSVKPPIRWHFKRSALVGLAAAYLVAMFAGTFFSVALSHEILGALNGNAVSISGGIRFACSRLQSILIWSLFAGIVGLLIQNLERRLGWLGRLFLGLLGTAWSVASVFVIPMMVRDEDRNPLDLMKKSARMLRNTWGESLIGYLGIQIGFGLIVVAMILAMAASFYIALAFDNFSTLLILIAVFVGSVATFWILIYLSYLAAQVYRCALYIYASEGVIPEPYDAEMMDAAWKIKNG